MTKREMFEAIVNGNITEEIQEMAAREIEKLDRTNANRKAKSAEKRAEKLEAEKVLEEGIMAILTDEPMTASDIKERVEGINSPQKATVVAKRLVAAGTVKVEDIKGKSGKVKGYSLA